MSVNFRCRILLKVLIIETVVDNW